MSVPPPRAPIPPLQGPRATPPPTPATYATFTWLHPQKGKKRHASRIPEDSPHPTLVLANTPKFESGATLVGETYVDVATRRALHTIPTAHPGARFDSPTLGLSMDTIGLLPRSVWSRGAARRPQSPSPTSGRYWATQDLFRDESVHFHERANTRFFLLHPPSSAVCCLLLCCFFLFPLRPWHIYAHTPPPPASPTTPSPRPPLPTAVSALSF